MTEGATHFAGKLVLGRLGCGIVPLEVVVAVREVDVGLVEDGGPLEGSGFKVARSAPVVLVLHEHWGIGKRI